MSSNNKFYINIRITKYKKKLNIYVLSEKQLDRFEL